jgi:hypothetical protein
MIEFVEECRREWKRLGVPDPIANEMALDITADIEEAEADGGSAEDVLGNSLFDPRRFAAAWASARGVTAPPTPVDPFTPLVRERHSWYRPAMVVTVSLFGFLCALAAAALLIGRHGVAVAATMGRRVALPGPPRWFGPTVHLGSGPTFSSQNFGPFAAIALVMLLVGFVVLGLVLVYWTSGPSRHSRRRFW